MMIAQSYTATEIIAIIGSVGGLITLIIGGIVTIMNARMKKAVKDEIAPVIAQVTETLAETKVIRGHVNSEKTAAEGRENVLTAENRMLREQLTKDQQVAAVLAAKIPVPLQVINGPQPTTSLPGDTNTEGGEKKIL